MSDTAPVAAAPAASTEESKFIKFFKDDDEGRNAPRQRWAGSTTFILAAIGSAIGLGNFWRFPYLTFKWGGGIWFIPYLIALMLLGLPMMLLELSLGQLFQRGDIGVFRGIHPRLYGVGLASVFSAFAINIFYTYLIAIAGCYLFVGITHPTLPWSIQRTRLYQETMCVDHIVTEGECIETVNEEGLTVVTGCTQTHYNSDNLPQWNEQLNKPCEMPAKCEDDMYITAEWFRIDLLRNYVVTPVAKVTDGIPETTTDAEGQVVPVMEDKCLPYDTVVGPTGGENQTTEFSWQIMLALLVTWVITYFCVFKGVKSSSYVVWVTVPGPIIFIFIMVMNNLCLENADAGIRMYLRGIDPETKEAKPASVLLGNGQMWADAVGQIFFSLGVCMGVMTSYSSYNRKNKPIIRDVMVISFGNCILSFFAGFAVFSVVGYLEGQGSQVKDNTSSSGLAFIAFPAAAEEMPGSNFWIILLGLTLFTLGIDTAFSLVEAISTVVYDTEKGKAVPRKLTALFVCVLGWLGSLLFCPSWGFTHFDVADRYISVYLMFILGIMQCFAAGWMFRLQNVMKMNDGANKTSIMLLSGTYWVTLLIMAPVTVFGLGGPLKVNLPSYVAAWTEANTNDEGVFTGEGEFVPFSMMWVGVLIFWVLNLVVIMLTFFMKKGSAQDWYQNVFFYGAYELANLVANKSDELRTSEDGSSEPSPCWKPIFVFWWAFSIKYFIPWALLSLMMWNFKADIDVSKVEDGDDGYILGEDGEPITRGYGNYHDMWQIVGFIYPLIGLICFLVPICIVTTPEEALSLRDEEGKLNGRKEVDLEKEEDEVHRNAELAYVKGLQAARDALIKMNEIGKNNEDTVATKN